MSDIPISDPNLQRKLSIESLSLAYAKKSAVKEVIFAVSIPYPLLKAWYNIVSTSNYTGKFAYTELLESCIPGHSFAITSEEAVRLHVNESLRKLASQVNADYGRSRGRKRKDLESRAKKFHILDGKTVSVAEMKHKTKIAHDRQKGVEISGLQAKNEDLQAKNEDLQASNEDLQVKNEDLEAKNEGLQAKNEELLNYIAQLENEFSYNGKGISEVQKKSRLLKTFMSRAEVALWFANSYGLKVESLTVCEIKSGTEHKLNIENANSRNSHTHGFENLSKEDQEKVEKVLFLLEDSFYHELTMLENDLPKSYLVKQRRDQLNKLCRLSSTPGEEEGSQFRLKDILTDKMRDFISCPPERSNNEQCIKVKISGDGAQMTRNSNFILMSFSLLQSSEDVMAACGNHTIAIVKSKEDYDVLKR
ncbi:Hypothetical predicted protein [Paramuricea clavata]|uniref:Uncharacterized protein n=1 Tax=Paramuricea clavata TaxID=317549 RepID=A0A6S7KCF4_PARCT|nr:Hypothetical predicted protein [Paramuricea clavata]